MDQKIKGLTDFQLSAIQEIGNIGSGHAAIALSQLIGRKIMIAVTKAQVVTPEDCHKLISDPDSPITGVQLKVLGDVQGMILLYISREPALILLDVLLNQKIGTTKVLGEMEESALKEMGSILSASYLNAISELTGCALIPSVPKVMFDKAGAILESVFEPIRQKSGMVIGIETEFIEASTRIRAQFIFMPDEEGTNVLLEKLCVGKARDL